MKEEEIRPQAIFDEYLRLAKKDTITYFENAERVSGNCPACHSAGAAAFSKYGFNYEQCPACHTLFVNPRPVEAAFSQYYTESPSAQYWASTFYKVTAEARREKLWNPKARLIVDILNRYTAKEHALVDIGGGYGLFAEEVRTLTGRAPLVIEPGPKLADSCRARKLLVVEKFLEHVEPEDLSLGPKAFTSFELFEHLTDPEKFLKQLAELMKSGDLFIFTTLSGSGVDIQALWEDSKTVSPPHHLNFFNPRSVQKLLKRLGFENLEITTPGKLDIDILANNQEKIKDRFWRTFIAEATNEEKAMMQEAISKSGWSSHMMIVCRKP